MPFQQISRHLEFTRGEWARLRNATPLPLTEEELRKLRGINEVVSLDEVAEIYLPLSRLLNLRVAASQTLHQVTDTFLGDPSTVVPFVIGIAGSVAVGKSTIARILQALLSRWPNHPKVDLVTTDGFLYPTRVLEERGLMKRKGFPESYDQRKLLQFLSNIKSGQPQAEAPVYSHLYYDVVQGEMERIARPDILILEGLNVLQAPDTRTLNKAHGLFVSDFFDFSIYIDADEHVIEGWYVDRFLKLCETVFSQPDSYFHRYSSLSRDEAVKLGHEIWREINGPNLRENIQPTRERANLILRKRSDHRMEEIRLRRL